jgi:TolB-like protein/DNA-binding winged helix-turn-helix (wHTH) protein/Tfp pilus assembly protein PilF
VHEPEATSHIFRFGVFEVDGRSRELRKQGVRIRLQEQPFQVLWLLLERAGDVVTREELRQRVWPSSVFVDFDHGLNNAVARVRDALSDDSNTPRFVETLPRLGYRFVCPVVRGTPTVATKSAPETPPAPAPLTPSSPPRRSIPRMLTSGLLVLVIATALATGLWLTQRSIADAGDDAAPAQPAVAVVPFVNMSEDVKAENFADGLTEELLHKLAGIRGIKIVGRASSSRMQGKTTNEVTRALNASHVVEGSVRVSEGRLRVTVQLIDAMNGRHLWSQAFDGSLGDILEMQETIATAIAEALQVELLEGDLGRLRSRGTHDGEAYRLYLMALTHLRGHGPRDPTRAKQLFEAALARDPQFAEAHAGLAVYYFRDTWLTLDDIETSARQGRAAAERAFTLAPNSADVQVAMANFEAFQSRFRGDVVAYERAQRGFRRAIEIDPTNVAAHFSYARAVEWDEPDLALRLFERAADLDPLFANAQGRSVARLNERGLHDAARERLAELDRQPLMSGEPVFAMYRSVLEMRLGNFDAALRLLPRNPSLEFDMLRWSLWMSLGDRDAARAALTERADTLSRTLREASSLTMDGRNERAYAVLDGRREEFPRSRVLDLPTARLALVIGQPARALDILESRLPDLARGAQPVTARNVIPALDLAAAYAGVGRVRESQSLLRRIATYLDGPDVPWLPLFTFLRARTHALADEREPALQALEQSYNAGFRKMWAIDLNPEPMYYVDAIDTDPAFAKLANDPRFLQWRARIAADNARQLAALRESRTATAGK